MTTNLRFYLLHNWKLSEYRFFSYKQRSLLCYFTSENIYIYWMALFHSQSLCYVINIYITYIKNYIGIKFMISVKRLIAFWWGLILDWLCISGVLCASKLCCLQPTWMTHESKMNKTAPGLNFSSFHLDHLVAGFPNRSSHKVIDLKQLREMDSAGWPVFHTRYLHRAATYTGLRSQGTWLFLINSADSCSVDTNWTLRSVGRSRLLEISSTILELHSSAVFNLSVLYMYI